MQTKKGFIGLSLLMAIIISVAVLGGGAYFVVQQKFPSQNISQNKVVDNTDKNTSAETSISDYQQNPTASVASDRLNNVISPNQKEASLNTSGMSVFPSSGTAPLSVVFSNLKTGASDQVLYFGDGQKLETGPSGDWVATSVTHTYTSSGAYTASLYRSMPHTIISSTVITVKELTQEPAPVAGTKTYTNSQYGFSIQYPGIIQIDTTPSYSKNDWWYPDFTNAVNLVSASYKDDTILFVVGTSDVDVTNCGKYGKSSSIGGVDFSYNFGNKGGFEGPEYESLYETKRNNLCYGIVISQSNSKNDSWNVLNSIATSFHFIN